MAKKSYELGFVANFDLWSRPVASNNAQELRVQGGTGITQAFHRDVLLVGYCVVMHTVAELHSHPR